MAERRKNPSAPQSEAEAEEGNATSQNGARKPKEPKDPSKYHVYTTDDEGGTLTWLKDVMAKTAEAAASQVVRDDESQVGKSLVVVPDRNLKTFSAQVETKTKVKVSAV